MKKTPIFVKMLIPIICVMLMQSGIIGIFLLSSGTVNALDDNAIGLLTNNAEVRGANLQDLMLLHWSNLDQFETEMTEALYIYLETQEISLDEFLGHRRHELDFMYAFSENVIEALRITATTGVFMYFLDGICPSEGGTRHLNGLYIRDLSALPNIPANLLFMAGYHQIARKHNISQDTLWTEPLVFYPEHEGMWRGFAYPQLAAQAMPDADTADLSFWNPLHYLRHNSPISTGQITYTRPVFFDGQMIAMIGTEMQLTAIVERHLPVRDFEYIGDSGYVLLLGDCSDTTVREILRASGPFANRIFNHVSQIQLQTSNREGVYAIVEVPDIRLVYRPLHIYNASSFFAQQQWSLIAMSTEQTLFSVSRHFITTMIIGLALSVLLGGLLVFMTIKRITQPIGLITHQLIAHGGDTAIDYKPSSAEMDLLCDTINHITAQRVLAENEIRRERQRYLLALESSNDTFIEYDIENDILQIFYFTNTPQQLPESKTIPDFLKNIHEVFHPHDNFDFLKVTHHEIRIKSSVFSHIQSVDPVDGYYWMSLKTILINDDSHGKNVSKVIGTAREITQEKVREMKAIALSQRDITSGCFHRDYGLEQIQRFAENAINDKQAFSMTFLHIENFETLELRFGLVFGGIFIAEFSHILLQFISKQESNHFITRLGNDEFLIFHGHGPDEINEDNIRTAFASLYTGGETEVRLNIKPFIYEKEFLRLKHSKVERPIKIFLDVANKSNLGNVAMELLERSPNIKSSVQALLGLIGRLFELNRIVACNYDTSLSTDQIAFEWNQSGIETPRDIQTISEEAFAKFQSMLDFDDTMVYVKKNIGFDSINPLLCIASELGKSVSMFCCALHNGTAHSGRMMFMAETRAWTDEEKDILRTLVKVISTYMDAEKNRSASKAKSKFLSRVSHEIRTPMNAIIGITNIAKDAVKNNNGTDIVNYLDKIGVSANYLLGLINDVLEMSRIESGKVLIMENNPFSLHGMIDDIEAVIRFSIESSGIQFIIHRDFRGACLTGDASRIKQVLINLLGNANKFTKPNGIITLSITEHEDEHFTFSVRDTGIGIPMDKQGDIFNAFEQAETPSITQKGTGLGLSISRNIIRAFGSDIELISEPDIGSEFYFTIQLPYSKEPIEAMKPAIDYSGYFTGKRILLVDDVEINLEVAAFILESAGFEVEFATNGQEAVNTFSMTPKGYFDAILMDIQMPVMDGITASTQIRSIASRADAPTIPIIALTANAFDEDWKKSAESGMNDHISKPINGEALLALLKRLLKKEEI
ncbi:MAG: ATP-binding protein [Defluviitaleaceae bacterium]|nr:ATP-binding protein [Defluviitaleaceae bacterium]